MRPFWRGSVKTSGKRGELVKCAARLGGRNPRLHPRNKTPLACMPCRPRVMLCDLTTCYSVECSWFQYERDKLVSNIAFSFNLRRYSKE